MGDRPVHVGIHCHNDADLADLAGSNDRDPALDEAARLFLAQGYAETTLRDIADAVGVVLDELGAGDP